MNTDHSPRAVGVIVRTIRSQAKRVEVRDERIRMASVHESDTDARTHSRQGVERKLRLFACACCRQVWDLLDDRSRRSVEVVERYVEGEASAADLEQSSASAREAHGAAAEAVAAVPPGDHAREAAYQAAVGVESAAAMVGDGVEIARISAEAAASARAWLEARASGRGAARERTRVASMAAVRSKAAVEQARLLRDIVGSPFRINLDGLASCKTERVVAIALPIYARRAFDRLPILADALEDAGCTDVEILAHCRQPGEHWRGCWVVDLILGKG